MTKRKEKNQGMNWIRPQKRLAIYLRDGLACCYCNEGIEDGAKLTLDHMRPYSHGGSNAETNLLTCCQRCNSSRGTRSWKEFALDAACYKGVKHSVANIKALRNRANRSIAKHLDAAKTLMASRNFSEALTIAADGGCE